MATCPVCGADFDERRFQLVLPGTAQSFDRFECALRGAARPPGGRADEEPGVSPPPPPEPPAAAPPRDDG